MHRAARAGPLQRANIYNKGARANKNGALGGALFTVIIITRPVAICAKGGRPLNAPECIMVIVSRWLSHLALCVCVRASQRAAGEK